MQVGHALGDVSGDCQQAARPCHTGRQLTIEEHVEQRRLHQLGDDAGVGGMVGGNTYHEEHVGVAQLAHDLVFIEESV